MTRTMPGNEKSFFHAIIGDFTVHEGVKKKFACNATNSC